MDVENGSGDIEMDFVGSLEPYSDLGSLEPFVDDVVSQLLLSQMGSSGKSYHRESATAARRIVSEIYSPPRVTAPIRQLKSRHVMPSYAFDLTTVDTADGLPWDFNGPAKRLRARMLIRQQKPYLLIGSPMCTAFSTWQRLNLAKSNDRPAMERARLQRIVHTQYVAKLYGEQTQGGR